MLKNDERRKRSSEADADGHDSDIVLLPVRDPGYQACDKQRPTCNQGQWDRIRHVPRYGHDRTPDFVLVNDDLIPRPVKPRAENHVLMESQEISESVPSDNQITSCSDRRYKGENG